MAAMMHTAALTNTGSLQQVLPQAKSTFLSGSSAGFAKVSSTTCCQGKPCHHAKRLSIVRAAEGSQEQAVTVEAAQETIATSPFANLSASVSTPSAPAASKIPAGPAVVGAGLIAAAGIAFLANKLAPKAAASAPAPVKAAVKEITKPAAALQAYPPRSVKEAAPAAVATMARQFPNAMEDQKFIRACAKELFSLGFSKDNCIALVNTCRDEVCRPLAMFVDQEFGLSFNIAGLGGLINCGTTGFRAGMSHSPEFPCDVNGQPRERYVFFAFPHVSVGETGEVGSLLRRGRGKPSNACGALIAIQSQSKQPINEDPDDPEFVLLKKKVLGTHTCKNCGPAGPDLVTVTKAALEVITEDLEQIISKVVNPSTADYAVITGVQIHSGNQVPGEEFRVDRTIDYIAPGTMYAVIQGKRFEMQATSGAGVKVVQSANA